MGKSFPEIECSVEKLLEQKDMELVDFTSGMHGHKTLLQFFIDRKNGGITLDDCAEMSELIEAVLDMEELVAGAYVLEVSSPGIKRALKKPCHFKQFTGERVKIYLKEPIEKRAYFTGIISDADDDKVIVNDGAVNYSFNYDNIKQARLDPVIEF